MGNDTVEFDASVFLRTLTSNAGVYRMLDTKGEVIYVGKARNLKKRLASYYRSPDQLPAKTQALMSHVNAVEVTVTHTETEALILENNLIKAFRPRYNVLLRDDKSYPYIHISTHERFPRLSFYRGTLRDKGRYFGPYPSAAAVRETLGLLQKLFQIRHCDDSFFQNRSRPCLQYQIKRCTAPCVGLVDDISYNEDIENAIRFLEGAREEVMNTLITRMDAAARSLDFERAARYRDQIATLRQLQERQYVSGERGNIDVIAVKSREGVAVVDVFFIRNGQNLGDKTFVPQHTIGIPSEEVLEAFLCQYYLSESANHRLPDEILVPDVVPGQGPLIKVLRERAGKRIAIKHRVRGERARWLAMAVNNAEIALSQHLARQISLRARFESLLEVLKLGAVPNRIECFDVSHTQGESAVAACVVFDRDGPVKSAYRQFNIHDVQPGDDYAALAQALKRRFTRLEKKEEPLPDLLLIDGGRGQLSQAERVLQDLGVRGVTVVGVAKGPSRKAGLEILFLSSREAPLILPTDSAALHLIQQVRDEAHRFAVTRHRSRRTRARRTSVLEIIPGIGAKRRQRLLREFGGLQGVARAGVENLARVKGISQTLAQAIYDAFR